MKCVMGVAVRDCQCRALLLQVVLTSVLLQVLLAVLLVVGLQLWLIKRGCG